MSASTASECFHCGEPIAANVSIRARLRDGQAWRERAVCCQGCKAVAELIDGAGLADYYRLRNAPGQRPEERARDPYRLYDRPELLNELTRIENGERSATLILDGMGCAACGWLIDRMLRRESGVCAVNVNVATARVHVRWSPGQLDFSQVLAAIARMGYRPHPLTARAAGDAMHAERHRALKRLAVATFGMMQVMMFAVALYAADFDGPQAMDATMRAYLRIASALCATPVLFYAGWPLLIGAWRAWRARSMTMDAPVALGLLLAYVPSIWHTFTQRGEVYFDSVVMFIFFLGVARFVEMWARHRTGDVTEALARLVPFTAHRICAGDAVEDIATTEIAVGDVLLVRVGETAPADGVVLQGSSLVDESMLTGEASGVLCQPGHTLAAGAINLQAPVRIRVTAFGNATALAGIVRLLERAQADKPPQQVDADRMAAWFLQRVLIGAGAVAALWLFIDPSRVLPVTLSVLVATCPCALSLAMPTTIAAATAALARRGVLVTRAGALEALAGVTHVAFDKTGTLTHGDLSVERSEPLRDVSRARCQAIAAALERSSEHPIARAFTALDSSATASDVRVLPGVGVEGLVDGKHYRIGRRAALSDDSRAIYLSDDVGELAAFYLSDRLRDEAPQVVAQLQELGLSSALLSGDAHEPVARAAHVCGIGRFFARQSPAEKLAYMQVRAQQGERTLMVGDGVNDAPVLQGATVSVAMARASSLAKVSSDIVLVGDALNALPEAIRIARRAQRIARQNLRWAVVYNFVALSAAAIGWLPPWLAAVGMSASSIVVVTNALRLDFRIAGRGARARTQHFAVARATHSLIG